ncbi:MAG TPA: reverse transcriptase family protein [Tepidisphaeraceae bacterium]|jgi:retron-type reverse transcriptase
MDPNDWRNMGVLAAVLLTLLVILLIGVLINWFDKRAARRAQEAQQARARQLLEEQRRRAERAAAQPSVVPPEGWPATIAGQPGTVVPAAPIEQRVAPPAASPALDLAAFAPMSDEQIKAAAQGVNLFTTFRFGLRSQIPPVTDLRTQLIDKALVAHGLLTPEELLEIHRVGQQMDQLSAEHAAIAQRANQAVAQALEDRARLKERKKAEAAERKRKHAEAVAQRRASDIVFLGRGVSKGLADRTSDAGKLTAAGLPVMATPADVAAALGLPIPRLRWLAFHAEAATRTHYVRFTIPKRSGGTRMLLAPHEALSDVQEWILRNVLDKVPAHAAAHGFVKTRSTVSNATPHVDRAVVVNTDLENFFPTITFPRVLGIFRQLGYSPAAATIFALLCTESPRRLVTYAGKPFHVTTGPRALPQGACTSPALSNLAARRLDSRLNGIAVKLGWTYTRYADDMTFSFAGAPADAKIGYLLARLRHIARDEGFAVNETKTRVLKRAARQEVTGVVVNKRPGVPRDLYKRLRAILHHAKTEGLAAQNRDKRPNFEAWLRGMIAYVSMVNEKQGRALADALARLG